MLEDHVSLMYLAPPIFLIRSMITGLGLDGSTRKLPIGLSHIVISGGYTQQWRW